MIGCRIVVQEQQGKERADYGSRLIENLSKELSPAFGGGVSVAQLWNFRQFYNTFPNVEILNTLCRELSWSHIRLIMRLSDEKERRYYIEESRNGNWSVRELQRNIKTDAYHRVVSTQGVRESLPVAASTQLKDPCIFEFLGINERVKESKLERAIIDKLQQFLLEMGRGFSFVDRQMHIATELSDFYIDLVFYNYILKCFVLVDLKTTQLSHQDIGQMQMYVNYYKKTQMIEGENEPIGILLCADKDDAVVEMTLGDSVKNVYASKYLTYMPSKEELIKIIRDEKELYELAQENER